MAWLSQQASTDLLQALRQSLGDRNRGIRALEEAILTVRSRLRHDGASGTAGQQRDVMMHALRPLWAWLMAEPDAASLDLPELSELTWNLLVAGLSRTQGADACPMVTGDLDTWNGVIQELLREHGTSSSTMALRQTPQSSSAFGPLHLVACGLFCLALDGWLPSGRIRVYMMMLGTMMLVAATMWWLNRGETASTGGSVGQPERLRSQMTNVGTFEADLAPARGSNQDAVAEPLPGMNGVIPAIPTAPPGSELVVGNVVRIADDHEILALRRQQGRVLMNRDDGYEVLLDSGIVASRISASSLKLAPTSVTQEHSLPQASLVQQTPTPPSGEVTSQFYAPFSGAGLPNKTQSQATRLKDALTKAHGLSATVTSWPSLFWQSVKNEKDLYGLDDAVKRVLEAHGYLGDASNGPPRVEELKTALGQLEVAGGPPHGAGGSILRGDGPPGLASDPEQMAWHLRLPSDLQRLRQNFTGTSDRKGQLQSDRGPTSNIQHWSRSREHPIKTCSLQQPS